MGIVSHPSLTCVGYVRLKSVNDHRPDVTLTAGAAPRARPAGPGAGAGGGRGLGDVWLFF